ncbi:MAG: DUF3089 domain-containing protein [Candidatus Limnocylindrales bacterium]
MRRTPSLLAVVAFLVAACGSSASTPVSTPIDPTGAGRQTIVPVVPASATPASAATPSVAPSVAPSPVPDDTVWLCKPGLTDNPCAGNLDATVIDASGAKTVEPAAPAADPPIDCFYVYPTVSRQTTTNANLTIDPEERAVAVAQAARFSQVCRVYAPMYPQLTLTAIAKPSDITFASALVAFTGVGSAWRNYLANYNHGRGVVLIGHSQGAFMLTALIKYQVDENPDARRLLVSALLLGGNVAVPVGKSVGGDFANVPACGSATQTGCVVAYSSFDTTPPADAVFGRTGSILNPFAGSSTLPMQILCVNPAAPGGGSGVLRPYFPTTGLSLLVGGSATTPVAPTPFVAYPGEYSAHCQTAAGATWLQIDRTGGATDHRPAVARSQSPAWGLHVVDVNIALGNLVDLVASEAAAFHSAG